MRRFNLYLTIQQVTALRQLQKRTGLTAAELIRRAIDKLVEEVRGKA